MTGDAEAIDITVLKVVSRPEGDARFAGGKPKVIHGPFRETNDVLGGYWMIQVNSKEEAIEWASRCPAAEGEVIEIRQVQEFSDFPAEVQQAARGLPDLQAHSEEHRRS